MVDYEYDDLFEEYKSDEEFEDSDVMDTPLRKAMRDAGNCAVYQRPSV
jgi:hypothetical protein